MSGHHLFGELRARMTPERRARNKAAAESMNREYVLSQIRQQLGLSQADMAESKVGGVDVRISVMI